MTKFSNSQSTPSLSSDLLFGAGTIANFVGVAPRKVYHWMDRRKAGKPAPPVFDVGGEVCGRCSELSIWFSGFRELSSPGARVRGKAGPENKAQEANHAMSVDFDNLRNSGSDRTEQVEDVRE